jgi:hypothetical protein
MRHRSAEDEATGLDAGDPSIFMPAHGCTSSSTARRNERASPSSVVMSRNMIPGLG